MAVFLCERESSSFYDSGDASFCPTTFFVDGEFAAFPSRGVPLSVVEGLFLFPLLTLSDFFFCLFRLFFRGVCFFLPRSFFLWRKT